MAISFVRQVGTPAANGANSSTIVLTVGASGAASGDLLIASVGWSSSFRTLGVGSLTDTRGNTWNVANQVRNTSTNANSAIVWSVLGTSLLSGDTITANFGGTVSAQAIGVEQYTGNTASPFDVAANSGTVSGTAVNPGTTVSTAQAEEMIVVSECHVGAQTQTAGAGYNGRSNPISGVAISSFMEEKQVSTTGTYGGPSQLTLSAAINYAAVVATFKAAAAGGSPVNTVAPAISGTVALGNTLTVSDGTWTNTPTSITYQWQRSSDSGSSWVNAATYTSDGGATSNTHTVVGFDVGSLIRCVVTATNASGSTSANSNSTVEVAPSSGPSYRMVALPIAQNDGQTHSVTLMGAVLANETMVLLTSSSVGNISGDMGSVTDPNGNTWTRDHDSAFGGPGTTTGHITQAFSAQNSATKLQIGATISNAIKQSTVVGAHAANSATIHVADVSIFDAGGSNLNLGAGPSPAGGTVAYTGIDVGNNLLTGCGAHSALTGGELIIYHGQSPYYVIYALNPGDGSSTRLAYDGSDKQHATTGTPSAGPITTTKDKGIAFTLCSGVGGSPGTGVDINTWLTPGSGWTADWAGYLANHLTGGARDAFGISYTGESGYKIGVQTRSYSAAATSITGNYTSDGTASNFADSMVIAYGMVASTPPVNTVAPAVTGTSAVGQTLTTTNGTWSNTPTGFTYQWQRDTAGNGTYANIAGQTASTHVLAAADSANNVRCVVTASNAAGSVSANSNALLTGVFLSVTRTGGFEICGNALVSLTGGSGGGSQKRGLSRSMKGKR